MRIKSIIMFAIIAAFIVAGMPHAQSSGCGLVPQAIQLQIQTNEPWYCPINQQIWGQWVNVLPLALIVVLISFLIAGVIFMTGVALRNDRIRNFGIGELYEAVATAIIVGAFLYVCAIVFGVIPSIAVGTINPYATALNLITTTIGSAQQMYTAIFKTYLSLSFIISPTINVTVGGAASPLAKLLVNRIPSGIVSFYTIPVQLYYLDPAQAIAGFISDGMFVLYAEYYLMIFFAAAAIPAFLIPGVFLRSIFPTRAVGGILIALAIGFYLVMPTLFAVAFYFTAPTAQANMQAATFQLTRFGSGAIGQAISPSSPLVQQLNSVQSSLNSFWLLMLFYPGLIIAMTYTAVEEMAKLIGESTALGGRRGSIRRFI